MDALRRLLLALLTMALVVVLGVVNMIYGWGVSPKSWGVIIGVGVFGQIFAHIIGIIASHRD